jgi:hypothetical protein
MMNINIIIINNNNNEYLARKAKAVTLVVGALRTNE